MKKYEDMTEDEREAFIISIEVYVEGDSFVKTPTFEMFELAVQCMGYKDGEHFLTSHAVTFEELKDNSWYICGNPSSLFIE